jgi:hypothetical protein
LTDDEREQRGAELAAEQREFRIRQRGELAVTCDVCNALPGVPCSPPSLDCACPTCAALLDGIHRGEDRGCPGGRREHAGRVYLMDPTIGAQALSEVANQLAEKERARLEAQFSAWEQRRARMLATRADNAARKAAGQPPLSWRQRARLNA